MTDFDWVGQWYLFNKENGLSDTANLLKVLTDSNQVEWHDFPHSKYDGIGALVKTLKKSEDEIPKSNFTKKPNIISYPIILIRALKDQKVKKVNWKFFKPSLKSDPRDFSWIILNPKETEIFEKQVTQKRTSENAYLLQLINSVVLKEFCKPNTIGNWLFPVNMRGIVLRKNLHSNMTSSINIKCGYHTSAEDIYAQIKGKLSKRVHWGNWWIYNCGKIVGLRGMRILSNRSRRNSFYLGTFSNMGKWKDSLHSIDGQETNCAWVCSPPGGPNYPIGIGIINWNSRLSISLKIHPSIGGSKEKSDQILNEIKNKILNIDIKI